MTADPKPGRRIVDEKAIRKVRSQGGPCVACWSRGVDPHHVIPKGEQGDDLEENLVLLCGSGSGRCHGAFHGSPYVVTIDADPRSLTQFAPFRERRDHDWVARRVGAHLLARRLDTVRYVISKLGDPAGRAYLERVYHADPVELDRAITRLATMPESQLRTDRPRPLYAP